jgi:aminomethyltransferase
MNKTALHEQHLALGAKMTDFHGWDMPLYYTSILDEHTSVRRAAGIFDISHMGQLRIYGPDAAASLDFILCGDVAKLAAGRALYSMILNEQGGILDDVILYRLADDDFLLIVNCSNRESDESWIRSHLKGRVTLKNISDGRCIVSVQGDKACQIMEEVLGLHLSSIPRFNIEKIPAHSSDSFIARTGYTGSDGFEMFIPDKEAVSAWNMLIEKGNSHGLLAIGLGARDTLRLEAGLRLYGSDMTSVNTPYEAGLGWTVAISKNSFIGKDALVMQKKNGLKRKIVGFELAAGPVPRAGCELFSGDLVVGAVTSGTFSPMLNRPIGMCFVDMEFTSPGASLSVFIRNKKYGVLVVKMPFWQPEANSSSSQVQLSAKGGK